MWKRKLNKKKRLLFKSTFFIIVVISVVLSIGIYTGVYFYIKHQQSAYISPVPMDKNSYNRFKTVLGTSSFSEKTLVESLLAKNNISYDSVIGSESAILVTLGDKQKIVFSNNKNIASQISSLQLVLSRFTIEGKKFNYLDFRFERPIVVFK